MVWLPTTAGSIASEISSRLLNYYKVTKTNMTFSFDAKDDEVWTGNLIDLQTRQRQDASGASVTKTYRVLKASEKLKANNVIYSYTVQSTDQDGSRYGRIGPNTLTTYSAESQANRDRYAFIAPNNAIFADGTEAYRIL